MAMTEWNRIMLLKAAIFVIIIVSAIGLFFAFRGSISGFSSVAENQIIPHTENLNLRINESKSVDWSPSGFEQGDKLKSIRLSGYYSGSFKIYLVDSLNSAHLIANYGGSGHEIMSGMVSANLDTEPAEPDSGEEAEQTDNTEIETLNEARDGAVGDSSSGSDSDDSQSVENQTANETFDNLISFENACIETCETDFSDSNYKLRVELESGEVVISEINYDVEKNVQVVLENITANITENITQELNYGDINILTPGMYEVLDGQVLISGTSAGYQKIEVAIDDLQEPELATGVENWSYSWDVSDLVIGKYGIVVIGTDSNGSTDEVYLPVYVHGVPEEITKLPKEAISKKASSPMYAPGNYTRTINTITIQDTDAYSGDTSQNGYALELRAGSVGSSTAVNTYLMFGLARIPANATITSATLYMYHYDDAGPSSHTGDNYTLYGIYNYTWNETSCFNTVNCPTNVTTLLTRAASGAKDADYWQNFTVTSFVQSQYSAARGNVSFRLNRAFSGNDDRCVFYSKEYGIYQPYLNITYTAPDPAPPEFNLTKDLIFDNATNQTRINLTVKVTGDPIAVTSDVDVMLVMDRSGSMDYDTPTRMSQAKVAAKEFVDSLDETKQKSGLVSFASSATLNRNLTFTKADVKTSIDALTATGSTAIGAGINTATNHFIARGRANATWFQILLTDGSNNAGADPVTAANNAAANNITIFTIGLGSGTEFNETLLRYIANVTGGQYYYAPTGAQLLAIYQDIGKKIAIAALSTTLQDILLANYVQPQPPLPPGCTNSTVGNSSKITCDIGDLSVGDTVNYVLNVTIDQNATNLTYLNEQAYINFTDYQGNPGTVEYFNNPPVNICVDNDNDTYKVSIYPWLQFLCGPFDCNDSNSQVNPGVSENCTNDIDDDCDGLTDCADSGCTNTIPCDNQPPTILNLSPGAGGTYNQSNIVPITANITDNVNISTVWAIVTWDATSQNLTLTYNSTSGLYEVDFTNTTYVVAGPEQYNITLFASDISGNTANASTYFYVQDVTPPSVTNVQPTVGTDYNQSQSVLISANVTDPYWPNTQTVLANISYDSTYDLVTLFYNSTSGNYEYTFTNTTWVGQYNVTFIANDTSGNTNNTVTTYFNVRDVIPPTAVINSPGNNSFTNDPTPQINFTLTDNYDTLINYTIFINDTPDGTGTVTNGTLTPVDLPTLTDGIYQIIVQGTDQSGNSGNSTPIILNVDTIPLSVAIINPQALWYKANFTVKANVTNGLALPQTVMFRWENETANGTYVPMTYNSSTGLYEALFDITTVADGNYTFRVWANDSSGNINNFTYVANVGIDDTVPSTTDNAPTAWQNADFSFNITCFDATSGCAATHYSLTGTLPFTPSALNPTTVTVSTEGIFPVYYYSVDNAGNNEYNTSIRTYVKLDKTDPTTTTNYTSTAWQSSPITLSLNCSDSLSGCYQTWYCIDTTNACDPYSGTQYNGTITHSTDGTYYIRFGSTDNANNYELAKSQILKIDSSAPTPPVLADPGDYSTTGEVTLNWTAATDPLSGISIYQVWRSTDNITFTQVDGNLSNTTLTFNDTGLTNNLTYYYYIKAYNGAGISSNSNVEDIIIDTDNPGVDIIYPADSQIFNTSSVLVQANFSDDNLVNCEIKRTGDPFWYNMNNDNATSGTADYTFTSLSDGYYNFTVKCYDESLNYGQYTVLNILVDTTLPTGTITINSGATYVNTTAVSLSLTYSDALSGVQDCRYSNDNSTWSSWEPCTSTKAWTLDSGDGVQTVYYQVRDNAGNIFTTSDTIILDTTGPVVDISSPANGSTLNDTTPEINFTITDNISNIIYYEIIVDGVVDQNGTAANGSLISVNISTALLEADHNITIVATDNAGNIGSDEIIITIAPQPPVIVINTPPYDGYATNDTTPEITFTITDNTDNYIDYVVFIDNSLTNVTGLAQYNVPVSFNTSTLAEGYHNITIEGTDDSGNADNETRLILVDLTPPTTIINSPGNNSVTNDSTPQINFTITDNFDNLINYTIFINGTPDGTGTVVNGTLTSVDLPTLSDGTYEIIIQSTDDAGNSANSSSLILTIDTRGPLVNILTPTGSVTQGNNVLITVNVTDPSGIDTVWGNVSWDNTSQAIILTYNSTTGLYQYLFTNTNLTGEYEIIVYANDTLGNIGSDTQAFNVKSEEQPPEPRPTPTGFGGVPVQINETKVQLKIVLEQVNPTEIGEELVVVARLSNVGNATANSVLASIFGGALWQDANIDVGKLNPGESKLLEFTLDPKNICTPEIGKIGIENLASTEKFTIKALDVSGARAEIEFDASQVLGKLKQLTILTDKKNYTEGEDMLVCVIVNNKNSTAAEAQLEFEFYLLDSRNKTYWPEYLGPYNVGGNSIFILTKTFSLTGLNTPETDDYTAYIIAYQQGKLFSREYRTGNDTSTVHIEAIEGESLGTRILNFIFGKK